jgi:WD40 repeat protein
MRKRTRIAVLAGVVAVCVASAIAYVGVSVARSHKSNPPAGVHVVSGATLGPGAEPVRTTRASSVDTEGDSKLLFVSMIPDRTAGSLAVAPLSDPTSLRAIAGLRCERVYYAGGHGICITRGGILNTSYEAKVFDSDFHVERQYSLPGLPSRARVSPDGRFGATTMFVRGDSYSAGNFSTRTSIHDLSTGKEVADLEKLTVTRDGKPFKNRNFNFWGVTFANDDDHFYASLGSGSDTYLLEGSIRDRTLKVIDTQVECPSLSPDGKLIAFKRIVGGAGNWRLFVLDLATKKVTRLAGDDPIDDQAEWLDDDHVVYGNDNKLWVVPADGSGQPKMLLSYAFSPAVSRTS